MNGKPRFIVHGVTAEEWPREVVSQCWRNAEGSTRHTFHSGTSSGSVDGGPGQGRGIKASEI